MQYVGLSLQKELVLSYIKTYNCHLSYCGGFIESNFREGKKYLYLVNSNGVEIGVIDKRLLDDKDVVLATLSKESLLFKYISKRLQDDEEVVMKAVKLNGLCLQYVSDRLKNDKEIAIEAVKQNFDAWQYIGKTIQNDKEIIQQKKYQEEYENEIQMVLKEEFENRN